MKIDLIFAGSESEGWIKQGIEEYLKRLDHYLDITVTYIALPGKFKTMPIEKQLKEEAKQIIKHIGNCDNVIILDEHGKSMRSVEFAQLMQKIMNSGIRRVIFIIGSAYGFSKELKEKYNKKVSLSKMTFSHQMARLFFVEQLYRSLTILRGESYHHE